MGRWWTLISAAHAVPFLAGAVLLTALEPILIPISLILVAHAWAIPELYANRGAKVVRRRSTANDDAEGLARLLLGDLLDHSARQLHDTTGLALQRGALGVWLLGEAGALLVRPGGHRVNCYCVKATGTDLPSCDRISHLLLALRTDEPGFATVANLAFSGACWRVRRRLPRRMYPALAAGVAAARAANAIAPPATRPDRR